MREILNIKSDDDFDDDDDDDDDEEDDDVELNAEEEVNDDEWSSLIFPLRISSSTSSSSGETGISKRFLFSPVLLLTILVDTPTVVIFVI